MVHVSEFAWKPAEEVVELVVAHINSTYYPRRIKALEETTDATINTTAKDPDRKSTRLNSSHITRSRMPSSA